MSRKYLIGISLKLFATVWLFYSNNNVQLSETNKQIIEEYLTDFILNPNFGGEIFVSYEILDTNKKTNEIYVWGLIVEYYKKGNDIEQGSGISAPYILYIDPSSEQFRINAHSMPRDGSYYTSDIKQMFPRKIHKKIFDIESKRISNLIEEVESKAKEKLLAE